MRPIIRTKKIINIEKHAQIAHQIMQHKISKLGHINETIILTTIKSFYKSKK